MLAIKDTRVVSTKKRGITDDDVRLPAKKRGTDLSSTDLKMPLEIVGGTLSKTNKDPVSIQSKDPEMQDGKVETPGTIFEESPKKATEAPTSTAGDSCKDFKISEDAVEKPDIDSKLEQLCREARDTDIHVHRMQPSCKLAFKPDEDCLYLPDPTTPTGIGGVMVKTLQPRRNQTLQPRKTYAKGNHRLSTKVDEVLKNTEDQAKVIELLKEEVHTQSAHLGLLGIGMMHVMANNGVAVDSDPRLANVRSKPGDDDTNTSKEGMFAGMTLAECFKRLADVEKNVDAVENNVGKLKNLFLHGSVGETVEVFNIKELMEAKTEMRDMRSDIDTLTNSASDMIGEVRDVRRIMDQNLEELQGGADLLHNELDRLGTRANYIYSLFPAYGSLAPKKCGVKYSSDSESDDADSAANAIDELIALHKQKSPKATETDPNNGEYEDADTNDLDCNAVKKKTSTGGKDKAVDTASEQSEGEEEQKVIVID